MQKSGLLSKIKSYIVTSKKKVRTVKTGILKGVKLPLNLQHDFQIYVGLWEREHYGWVRKMASGVDTFVDIGAKFGHFSMFGLDKTNAQKVIAIEPRKKFHQKIRKSRKINDYNKERLSICSFLAGKNDVSDRKKTVDSIKKHVHYPCFIKCDVDGPEADVLEGSKNILKNGDVRILVETHSKKAERRCISFLENLGYETVLVDNAWWRKFIPENRPPSVNRWIVSFRH